MPFWITSDETLMTRVQAHADESAFVELVHRWQARLEQASYRILNDRHRSEDLVQEAFTRLFLKRAQYRKQAKFSSYLWRITLNLCQDELRRRVSRERLIDPLAPIETENALQEIQDGPDSEAESNEEAAAVRSALGQLPDPVRIIVVMRHYHDMKFREIAEALDLPESTVKTRMTQGLTLLAKHLNPLFKCQARSDKRLTDLNSTFSYETSFK